MARRIPSAISSGKASLRQGSLRHGANLPGR